MNARALARTAATRRRAARAEVHAAASGPYLISTLPPGRLQLTLARVVTSVLAVAFLVALTFRHVQLVRLDSFIPIANTVVGLNDFLTAFMLYAQFSVTRARALLVLASGFLFKTLILIPHAVTFPGVFGTYGLLEGRLQSTTWLFPLQQIVFGICAITYTLLSERGEKVPPDNQAVHTRIVAAAALTVAAAVTSTWILIAQDAHLPRLVAADAVHVSDAFRRIVVPMELSMCLGAIVVLLRRPRSMIDLWLQVVMWSWVFEAFLTMLVPGRFSFIFYANRAMGMVSSGVMLIVLLSESLMLHRRLVLTRAAREQEREGHRTTLDLTVAALAHELSQPLTAIMINGQAGETVLSATPADVDEARATFQDITRSVERAIEVIHSVRTMFAHSPQERAVLDVNALVHKAAGIMRLELETYHITLELDLSPDLPTILGHRGQLTQVLMNGVRNAVESLAAVADGERLLRLRALPLGQDCIAIRIEDSGGGVAPRTREHVFEPFFSTKPRGMGLGLAICKSIVERHGGSLSLVPRIPRGAIFQIRLPAFILVEREGDGLQAPRAIETSPAAAAARPLHSPG